MNDRYPGESDVGSVPYSRPQAAASFRTVPEYPNPQPRTRSYPAAAESPSEYPLSLDPPQYTGRLHGGVRRPLPSRPLKVICAGPSFQIGGVEQHTISLAKFFDPRRVQLVKSLVTNPSGFDAKAASHLPFPIESCGPEGLVRATRECDAMLLWGEGFNGRLGCHPPIGVFLAHGESPWTRLCLEGSSDVVDHVIAVSSRVNNSVCQGFPTTTILNGVDSARLGQFRSRAATREQFGFEPCDFVLGSVGRFTNEKRMHLLIDAVATLPKQFKLLLVGYGPRRAELLERANDLIPGRYAFAACDEYIGDMYYAMDAFSLVSSHEGFGLVIPEAMLCERPVIATNVGCVPEVLRDRVNGIVVDGDPNAIASAVRALRDYPHWAKGLAAEGRALADSHFHAARMAAEYEDLLWQLAQSRGIH